MCRRECGPWVGGGSVCLRGWVCGWKCICEREGLRVGVYVRGWVCGWECMCERVGVQIGVYVWRG